MDPEVNRELFQRFSDERPMKLGNWVALARQIRERFVTLDKITVLADLAAVDFGNHGDEAHPVAQLLGQPMYLHGRMDAVDMHKRRRAAGGVRLQDRRPGGGTGEDASPGGAMGQPATAAVPAHPGGDGDGRGGGDGLPAVAAGRQEGGGGESGVERS